MSERIRARITALSRRLRPAALVREWYAVLPHVNARWERGCSEAALWEQARRAAATGQDPGTVLAELLREAARAGGEEERAAPVGEEETEP